ncbi:MAG: hypothetical protein WC865_10520 [Bacteroidales bacterium]
MKTIIGLLILGGLFLSGCEEDPVIQVDGFQSHPVIYSMINVNDTEHYIRVERFYSGNAAAEVTGKNPDSLYYKDPKITVVLIGPTKYVTLTPVPVLITDKEEGFFQAPDYQVYKFNQILKNTRDLIYSTITIKVEVPGLPISIATTALQVSPVIWNPYKAQETFYIVPDSPIRIQWSGGDWNEVDMSFEIMEQYPDSLAKKVVRIQRSNDNFITGHYYEVAFSFELLVELINKQLKPNRNLVRRYFGYVHTQVHTGNRDFAQYMQWLNGINDFNDLSYTNVVNGHGLVASRSTTVRDSLLLDYWSRMGLADEPRLEALGFIEY